MRPRVLAGAALLCLAAAFDASGLAVAARQAEGTALRDVDSFAGLADSARRSAALFAEAGKVLTQSPLRELPSVERPPAAG